jgi:hypothetical protein
VMTGRRPHLLSVGPRGVSPPSRRDSRSASEEVRARAGGGGLAAGFEAQLEQFGEWGSAGEPPGRHAVKRAGSFSSRFCPGPLGFSFPGGGGHRGPHDATFPRSALGGVARSRLGRLWVFRWSSPGREGAALEDGA